MKILLVDDTKHNRVFLESLLKDAGFEVVICEDAYEGLLKLKSEKFDLVLSDVNMPNMDGFQLTEKIKRSGDKTEIMLYTASDSDLDLVNLAKEIGAVTLIGNSNLKNVFQAVLERFNKAFDENQKLTSQL